MPEPTLHETAHNLPTVKHVLGMAGMAMVIALGHLLNSPAKLSWRRVSGRAIIGGGLGVASTAVLTWMPEIPIVVQFGVCAAIASFGTDGIEKLLNRLTGQSNYGYDPYNRVYPSDEPTIPGESDDVYRDR